MLKPLRNKHLLDVCKALKIKDLTHTPKPLQSHSKATPKTTPKHQTVENQALDEIFWSFGVCSKNHPTKPAHPLGTIFAGKMPVFSIHISITPKTPKKNTKPLKIKGLRFWSSLWSGFGVALEFVALLQKACYNKAPPKPHPLPSTTIKPLKIKRCMMLIKPLKLKHLIRLLLS
jgi:hypothetical protein